MDTLDLEMVVNDEENLFKDQMEEHWINQHYTPFSPEFSYSPHCSSRHGSSYSFVLWCIWHIHTYTLCIPEAVTSTTNFCPNLQNFKNPILSSGFLSLYFACNSFRFARSDCFWCMTQTQSFMPGLIREKSSDY